MAMIGAMARARQLAMNPAAAALMIGATRHKAETAEKNADADGKERASKAKVTLDVGSQTITTKDLPVEDMQTEKNKAYDQPYRELAATAARMAANIEIEDEKNALAEAGNEWSGVLPKISDIWRGKGRKSAMKRAIQLRNAKQEAREFGQLAQEEEKAIEERDKRRRSARAEIEKSDLSELNLEDLALRSGLDASDIEKDRALVAAIERRRNRLTLDKAKGEFVEGEKERKEVEREERQQARDDRAEAREARAEAAAARAAAAAERSARSEERSVNREEKTERYRTIKDAADKIDRNSARILENSLKFSKLVAGEDDGERAELQRQNAGLVEETRGLRDQLDQLLGKKTRVGARKKFPNGKMGEWDGKGWVEVR